MTKTIFHMQPMPRPLARSLGIAALLVILALSVGGAVAERMEQRASQDRFAIGEAVEQH
jgi:hypothetical protein